jgi:hypothetical protein
LCCAAACDACSLQQLVNSIYPVQQAAAAAAAAAAALQTGAQQQQQETQRTVTREVQPLQRQQQQQQQLLQHEELPHPSELHSSNSSYRTSLIHPHHSSSSSSSKSSSSTAAAVPMQRQAEVSAALLLYFVCVPRQPIMQELVKQLKAAAGCCLGPDSSSSSCSSSSNEHSGADAPKPLLLLQHPTYQLAVQAAAAYLNCNWVQFMRCYEQQPPMLMRVVMECAVQRMRLHTVHSVVAAYRMLPSSVLVRWLGLQIEQQQQQAAETKTAGSGALEDETRKQLVGVMLQAGERGCKGARFAAEQCMISDVALPDTLQFRGSS